MSYTNKEVQYEQGMAKFYNEFIQQYEDDVVFTKVFDYYETKSNLIVEPLSNLKEAENLIKKTLDCFIFILSNFNLIFKSR